MSDETVKWMQNLDAAYRRASGVAGFNEYKIFSGPVIPAPVLVLGLNPGGDPATWRLSVPETAGSRDPFYGDGSHDFDVCDYPEARAMRHLLNSALRVPRLAGSVVKSNLVFRRSARGDRGFRAFHGIDMNEAAEEARPFVTDIMARTDPAMILLEGQLLPRFTALYGEGDLEPVDEPVLTPAGPHSTMLYEAYRYRVPVLARHVTIVKIAHPSTFGGRYRKARVDDRIRGLLECDW
ncbi:hypothetical protein KBTX_02389 [wastewater metagenome]|uniref:Uracil DNA glycosylase superfamily n=2 Tax=unclassified sequences TaxID=12908 RepID=A0A5B8RB82_9ZZZZ|nr:hypothetical protein [Arhodomonas sp. KWT]QEA06060.1 hypothetical protein KBTEX_02389 [uncultured organism]